MRDSITPNLTLLKIVQEKHEQVHKEMEGQNIDCWIVFMRETASNPDPVQALVIGGECVWTGAFVFSLKNGNFTRRVIVGNFDADAEIKKGIAEPLKKLIGVLNPEKIALNYSLDDVTSDGLSHGLYLNISTILEDHKHKFMSAEPLIKAIRSKKTETEVELVTNACILTEKINNTVQEKLKVGMTEIEIQQMFYDEMENNNVIEAWERTSCPAIDAGPDKSMGHIGPTPLETQKGHTLHNDFGVTLHGYTSDIQRMWFFGKEEDLPEELIHAFDTVHGAISRAAEFIKPGVKGVDVDTVARDYVLSRGYKEYDHALGHQVGTKAHDGGTLLAPKWERYGDLPDGVIESGNIFTLELYVTTENFGMVSLEEDIVITEDSCRFLVPRQEKWICLE